MEISLPLIGGYTYTTQSFISLLLLFLCYFNQIIRSTVVSFISVYAAYRIIIPVSGWIVSLLKGVAWCGFYVFFCLRAVEYGSEIWQYVMQGVDMVASENLKQTMSQERDSDPAETANERELRKHKISQLRKDEQRDRDREQEMHGFVEELEDDDLADLGLHDGTFPAGCQAQAPGEDHIQSPSVEFSKPRKKKRRR